MSRLLPVDVEKQQFQARFRGYDREQVRQFLKLTADEMEALILKTSKLEDELKAVNGRLRDFEEREKVMREALYTAQKAAEETRQNALKEGELIVREAEQKAEKLIGESRVSAFKIERESMDLRLMRDDALRDFETLVMRFLNLVEVYRQSRDAEGKLRVMGKAEE